MNNFHYLNFILTTLLKTSNAMITQVVGGPAFRLPLPEPHPRYGGSLSEWGPVLDHTFGRYTGQLFLSMQKRRWPS